jgi:CRISPR system Cascade subunit CasA
VNLLRDEWIPARRASGINCWVAPWQLTLAIENDPIVSLTYVRPDLAGSVMQFLIAILQTATPDCEDEDAWDDLYLAPPNPDTLQEWFAPWVDAFNLDGEGPRFMQDSASDVQNAQPQSIAALLIDSPGGNTLKLNTDHFIKRGAVKRLSPKIAAAVLFNLQTNAPAGGQGNRTSLRGGGPLTTLVMSDPRVPKTSLWHDVWLNVLDWERFAVSHACQRPVEPSADIFPWLAPTRTSNPKERGVATTSMDAHPLQMYWATPRRVWLDFETQTEGACDLGGGSSTELLTTYRAVNYGINYEGPWRHPLSPYYFDKEGSPLPVHIGPGGLQYRHWMGLVQAHDELRVPAYVVTAFRASPRGHAGQFCLWAFGFDMDNMKARGWYEARLPLFALDALPSREAFEITVGVLVEAANLVRAYLSSAVKEAWFRRPGDAKGDMGAVDLAFWRASEPAFYDCLAELHDILKEGNDDAEGRRSIRQSWHTRLKGVAMDQFSVWATRGNLAFEDPERIATAHRGLRQKLFGKRLRTALDLPLEALHTKEESDHATA